MKADALSPEKGPTRNFFIVFSDMLNSRVDFFLSWIYAILFHYYGACEKKKMGESYSVE